MSRKVKIWLITIAVLVVLVVVAILILSKWMNSSNDGTVRVGTASTTTDMAPQAIAVKTSYFTATLPAGFSVKRQTETLGGDPALQIDATTPATTDQELTIALGPLPSGGLTALGDYNLRASQSSLYNQFVPDDLPAGGTAFKNATGPTGFVAFWPHNGKYVEVAVSTDGLATADQLQASFSQVVSSWKWQ